MLGSVLITVALGASKMAVLSFTPAGGVDPTVATALTEAVTAEVAVRGYFEPISSSEVMTLLGVERQKQLLGCSDDANACMAEVAGALGAPFVMSGSVTRLEGVLQLNVQVLDTRKAVTLGRSTKLARDFESLRALIPWAVAEACGTPIPPPPSRVLPYSLIGVGGAAVIAGGVLGIVALNNESTVRGQLSADDQSNAVVLQPAQTYQEQLDRIAAQKTVALISMLAGAALIATGIVIMPGVAPEPGVKVSLAPFGAGAALVGVFP